MHYKWPRLGQDAARSRTEYPRLGTSSTDAVLAPLSRAQERLWFMEQLEPGNPVYNLSLAVRVHGSLERMRVERALNQIAGRHAPLRATFAAVDGVPVQIIAPKLSLKLATADLRQVAPDAQHAELDRLLQTQAQRAFNLAQGPLVRALLIQVQQEEWILSLTLHRVIFDEASAPILWEEMSVLYSAAAGSEPLAPLPFEYLDYCEQQRRWLEGEQAEAELSYWRQQLGALSTLQLLTDHARPAVQSYRGARRARTLAPALVSRLAALASKEGATVNTVLLAAFQVLLHRYTHQDDIAIGFPVAGRHAAGRESIIGPFENNLVLRADFSGDPTFVEALGRVRQVVVGAEAHQTLPFERLVEDLAPERQLSRTPLFQVMFRAGPPQALFALGDAQATELDLDPGTARFDLVLHTRAETDGSITYAVEHNTDLFDSPTIERMLDHYAVLLDGIASAPTESVEKLSLLPEAERQQLLVGWNQTAVPFPKDKCLHQLFEAQVAQTPDAPAAQHNGATLSYQQLNARANGWGSYLGEQGLGPDVVAAILADRGLDFLTAILAVFKAGGAYLPLDPQHPAARIHQILEQSRARLVLVSEEYMPLLAQALEGFAGARPVVVTLEKLGQLRRRAENLPTLSSPRDLAYVIYTSGSTGAPKGAMVEQVGMVNHLYAKINDLKLTHTDIVAQNASQCFDISVWQFLAGLLVGGQTCIFGDEVTYDPPRLLDQIQDKRVTVLEIVPSVLRFMVEEIETRGADRPGLQALRWLVPTGEALPPSLCRRWLELYPNIHVVNAYGPTECSDDVTHCFIDRPPAAEVVNMPVGRPIQNMRMYILDENLQLTPIGIAGELHVGGIGVGRGYLGRPDLTAERFIHDPFSREPGARLYKTGDLARYLADGSIEYMGRIDYQVKVRGFRIELAEIEAALALHPNIRESVVVAREDTPGENRLVAYYVARQTPAPSGSELRRWLKEKLPEYMVPTAFVALDAMPLTSNGKINRKALPVPPPARPELDMGFVAPRDAIELQLTQLWEEVLGVTPVGAHDNFFELGGHSLLAVRLFGEIQRRMGRKVQLATLFESPTVEQLANVLRQKAETGQRAALVPIQPQGTRPPVFFVHPIGGDILGYISLSRFIAPDQPLYGLRARGLDGTHVPDQSIPDMAASYIQEIFTVDADGPFYIGGYSFGGTVAFEMARQLVEMGKQVALLVVIDDGPPDYEHSFKWSPTSVAGLLRDLPFWVRDDLFQGTAGQVFGRLVRKLKRGIKQLTNKLDPTDITTFEPEFEDMVDVASIPEYYRAVWKANYQAVSRYAPQPYSGKLTLLRVRAQPLFSAHLDDMGWRRFVQGGVEVRIIPGYHEKVLVEPNVQVLAEQLGQALAAAQAKRPPAYIVFPVSINREIPAE